MSDEQRPNPTDSMSTTDKVLAGAGQAMVQSARMAGNALGVVSDEEMAEAARLDAPLLDTTAGKVGAGVGYVAEATPVVAGAVVVSESVAITAALAAMAKAGVTAATKIATTVARTASDKVSGLAAKALAPEAVSSFAPATTEIATTEVAATATAEVATTATTAEVPSLLGRVAQGTVKLANQSVTPTATMLAVDKGVDMVVGVEDPEVYRRKIAQAAIDELHLDPVHNQEDAAFIVQYAQTHSNPDDLVQGGTLAASGLALAKGLDKIPAPGVAGTLLKTMSAGAKLAGMAGIGQVAGDMSMEALRADQVSADPSALAQAGLVMEQKVDDLGVNEVGTAAMLLPAVASRMLPAMAKASPLLETAGQIAISPSLQTQEAQETLRVAQEYYLQTHPEPSEGVDTSKLSAALDSGASPQPEVKKPLSSRPAPS